MSPKCVFYLIVLKMALLVRLLNKKKGVPSAESSRSMRGLGKGVSGKPYPRLCNARRLRLEPGTFRSQAVRLYRLQKSRYIVKTIDLEKLKQPIIWKECHIC